MFFYFLLFVSQSIDELTSLVWRERFDFFNDPVDGFD
jgi:hypothetical protein